MKRVYPIFLLLSICFSVQAQTDSAAIRQDWEASINAILQRQSAIAPKTTQLKQRVIGITDSTITSNITSLRLRESDIFKYSGGKGSTFDLSPLSYLYDDNTTNSYGYGNTNVNSDTAIVMDDQGNGFKQTYRYIDHYTPSGKKDTVVLQLYDTVHNIFISKTRNSVQYNAAGSIAQSFNDTWDATSQSWKSYNKTVFLYNFNNQETSDSSYNLTNGAPAIYARRYNHYDLAGNLDTVVTDNFYAATWTPYTKFIYTYNANNLLKEAMTMILISNAGSSTKDSFDYTPNVSFYTYRKRYSWSNTVNGWTNSNVTIKYLNSLAIPDSMITITASGITDRKIYTYNTYGNPISMFYYESVINVVTNRLMDHYSYYYETYDDLAVKEVSSPSNLLLYPNPATATLNIQRSKATSTEFVNIYNALGQKTAQYQLDNSLNSAISITDLTPGIYWLVLHNSDGSISARQSFIKK